LSLFLPWPTGRSIGLVLAVPGIGIWVGGQHLGYLEFGELARVAQRALGQRQTVINDLAIRRATEELKVAREYERICGILVNAFSISDFEAFDLQLKLPPAEIVPKDVSSLPQTRKSEFSFHLIKGFPIPLSNTLDRTLPAHVASD
jgi:hypothetical protein